MNERDEAIARAEAEAYSDKYWENRWFPEGTCRKKVVCAVGITLFMMLHGILCFLTMLGLVDWEYYHGKRIQWRKKKPDSSSSHS